MTSPSYNSSLIGNFLVASPKMLDPRFARSVIYICSHTNEGAMGLVINKPALNLSFEQIMSQLDIKEQPIMTNPIIYFGGPVELERGFIIHTSDYDKKEKMSHITKNIVLSFDKDILADIATGKGPKKVIITIGYSGWHAGQLEKEIKENSWIEIESDESILFSDNYDKKWDIALKKIGFEINDNFHARYSPDSGNA